MRYFILGLIMFLSACGQITVKGRTEHDVVVKTDLFGECLQLKDPDEQAQCIQAITKLMEMLAAKSNAEAGE